MADPARRAAMIARDQRNLLRRIANIYPGPGGGMDPSPGGGGYSGPGGGKYIGPSRYAEGGAVDHEANKARFLKGSAVRHPVYHGTSDNIQYFSLTHPNRKDAGWLGHGIYLTESPQIANAYATQKRGNAAPNVMKLHARITKPYYATTADKQKFRMLEHHDGREAAQQAAMDWTNELRAKGHDGVIYEGPIKGSTEYVVFDPENVKSATGNRGTFDTSTDNVNYADGGSVPPFKLHSGAAKIIGAKGQKKATPQQYAAMPGIKPDELKHSKFDTLGSKALPREEVIKHLEDNAVPLQESELRDEQPPNWDGKTSYTASKFAAQTLPGGENYREVLLHTPAEHTPSPELEKARERSEAATRAFDDALYNQLSNADNADDEAYQRASEEVDEARIALARLERTDKTAGASAGFRGGHWDQPNVVAHVRMSDRVGPKGEKILHLEEAQSDWGQQGRDQGFHEPGQTKYEVYNRRSGNRSQPFDTQEEAQKYFETLPDSLKGQLEVRDFDTPNTPGLPRGPYVDNTQKWTDLALKRVLHEAAHGGYDKIVVTPGDEQNKRYDLSSQVKNISYFPDIGYLHATTHDNEGIDHNDVKPEDLAKHIGKEAADRILKQGMQRYEGRGRLGGEFYHELEGDDLKMGGAGMRGYYDNILPKRLQALAQQHDPQAKVQLGGYTIESKDYAPATGYTDNNKQLHSLDVTPQMRGSIKGNGFSSFKRGGDVGMRQRYADGGGADNPVVSRALDLTSLAQPRSPIAQAQSALRNITTQPTEVGKTSVKSLSDAFDKGISEHLALKPADRIANSKRAADSLGAHIGRLQTGRPVPLLSKNAKLLKSETGYGDEEPVQLPDGRGVETVGLALAPAYEEGKFTTCPNSASCKAECLGKTSGNYFKVGGGKDLSAFKGPRLNSLKKTIGMLRDPENFAVRLNDEIESAKREAAMNGNHLGIRLNVLSDLNPRIHKAIIENHPDVTFYDYTKNNTNPIAPNHHYTYSSTGVSQDGVDNPHSNWKQMRKRLDTGSNVAMAFSDREHLPEMVHDEETGKHYKVVNGDKHDFRPLDIQPRGADGVIVGLKNKKATGTTANAHVESKGFFVKYDPQLQKNANGTYVRGESVGLRKDGKPMLGATIPTNRIVTIKSQRAAPALKTNDAGGGK